MVLGVTPGSPGVFPGSPGHPDVFLTAISSARISECRAWLDLQLTPKISQVKIKYRKEYKRMESTVATDIATVTTSPTTTSRNDQEASKSFSSPDGPLKVSNELDEVPLIDRSVTL